MTSPWQPGQLLFAGFEGKKVPSELANLIEQGRVGGVILFTRNLGDPRHVAGLVRELRRLAPERAPLTVAIEVAVVNVDEVLATTTFSPRAVARKAAGAVE